MQVLTVWLCDPAPYARGRCREVLEVAGHRVEEFYDLNQIAEALQSCAVPSALSDSDGTLQMLASPPGAALSRSR
jgi:hypothetical protein